jgi:outer membrane receptor protein involved in Fe transport
MGVELEGRTRVKQWLWVDGDVALSRGRFRDAPAGENRIPLAPTVTANGGLTLRDLVGKRRASNRYLGGRAADEANTIRARGYMLLELFGAYELGSVRLFAPSTIC